MDFHSPSARVLIAALAWTGAAADAQAQTPARHRATQVGPVADRRASDKAQAIAVAGWLKQEGGAASRAVASTLPAWHFNGWPSTAAPGPSFADGAARADAFSRDGAGAVQVPAPALQPADSGERIELSGASSRMPEASPLSLAVLGLPVLALLLWRRGSARDHAL